MNGWGTEDEELSLQRSGASLEKITPPLNVKNANKNDYMSKTEMGEEFCLPKTLFRKVRRVKTPKRKKKLRYCNSMQKMIKIYSPMSKLKKDGRGNKRNNGSKSAKSSRPKSHTKLRKNLNLKTSIIRELRKDVQYMQMQMDKVTEKNLKDMTLLKNDKMIKEKLISQLRQEKVSLEEKMEKISSKVQKRGMKKKKLDSLKKSYKVVSSEEKATTEANILNRRIMKEKKKNEELREIIDKQKMRIASIKQLRYIVEQYKKERKKHLKTIRRLKKKIQETTTEKDFNIKENTENKSELDTIKERCKEIMEENGMLKMENLKLKKSVEIMDVEYEKLKVSEEDILTKLRICLDDKKRLSRRVFELERIDR